MSKICWSLKSADVCVRCTSCLTGAYTLDCGDTQRKSCCVMRTPEEETPGCSMEVRDWICSQRTAIPYPNIELGLAATQFSKPNDSLCSYQPHVAKIYQSLTAALIVSPLHTYFRPTEESQTCHPHRSEFLPAPCDPTFNQHNISTMKHSDSSACYWVSAKCKPSWLTSLNKQPVPVLHGGKFHKVGWVQLGSEGNKE